ncbi:MAG: DUF6883 domain-containing protein [Nostoc sp.]|uniref:DUF6883 domain-containing protein n=1 Tax=Nostoc sp. TaxID=1180 RepID=UPI002FF54A60
MKLPNGEQAEISVQKLIGYCLNPEHPSGKHKARVFASILEITVENADVLRELRDFQEIKYTATKNDNHYKGGRSWGGGGNPKTPQKHNKKKDFLA